MAARDRASAGFRFPAVADHLWIELLDRLTVEPGRIARAPTAQQPIRKAREERISSFDRKTSCPLTRSGRLSRRFPIQMQRTDLYGGRELRHIGYACQTFSGGIGSLPDPERAASDPRPAPAKKAGGGAGQPLIYASASKLSTTDTDKKAATEAHILRSFAQLGLLASYMPQSPWSRAGALNSCTAVRALR